MDAYSRGLNGRQAAWAARKSRGHRVLPESIMNDLEKASVVKFLIELVNSISNDFLEPDLLKTSIYPVDCPKFVYLIKTFLIWLTCHSMTTLPETSYDQCDSIQEWKFLTNFSQIVNLIYSNLFVAKSGCNISCK